MFIRWSRALKKKKDEKHPKRLPTSAHTDLCMSRPAVCLGPVAVKGISAVSQKPVLSPVS